MVHMVGESTPRSRISGQLKAKINSSTNPARVPALVANLSERDQDVWALVQGSMASTYQAFEGHAAVAKSAGTAVDCCVIMWNLDISTLPSTRVRLRLYLTEESRNVEEGARKTCI